MARERAYLCYPSLRPWRSPGAVLGVQAAASVRGDFDDTLFSVPTQRLRPVAAEDLLVLRVDRHRTNAQLPAAQQLLWAIAANHHADALPCLHLIEQPCGHRWRSRDEVGTGESLKYLGFRGQRWHVPASVFEVDENRVHSLGSSPFWFVFRGCFPRGLLLRWLVHRGAIHCFLPVVYRERELSSFCPCRGGSTRNPQLCHRCEGRGFRTFTF